MDSERTQHDQSDERTLRALSEHRRVFMGNGASPTSDASAGSVDGYHMKKDKNDMAYAILEELLDLNLLENLGEDESRYAFLTETSSEVADLIQDDIALTIPHVLVAIDPNISVDESLLEDVERRLKSRWKLLRQKYPDRPRQLLRAIILQAIDIAAHEDQDIAAIAWLTGSSFLPVVDSGSVSDEVCRKTLLGWLELVGTADRYSFDDLTEPPEPDGSSVIVGESDIDLSVFDMKHLELKWASLFANDYLDQPIPAEYDPVPFPPGQFNYMPDPNWLKEFAPKAAKFFLAYVDFIHEQNESIARATTNWLKSRQAAARGDSLRLRVIWWKQAMYSQSMRLGYRELSPQIATFAMALDLHNMIPSIYPLSIDYVLQENLRALIISSANEPTETVTIPQFIEILAANVTVGHFSEFPYLAQSDYERTSLVQYIAAKLSQKANDFLDLQSRVGIDPTIEIKLTDLAVWLFRNYQALRLTAESERNE